MDDVWADWEDDVDRDEDWGDGEDKENGDLEIRLIGMRIGKMG